MTTYTGTDPRVLDQIRGDIRQLTQPIHVAVQRRIITHPPLIDQLHAAAFPGHGTRGPERRRIPDSRPPIALDPVDALIQITADLDQWRDRLRLPAVSIKRAIAAIPNHIDHLAPAIADWLARDVHHWWHTAAIHSGWQPRHLLKLR